MLSKWISRSLELIRDSVERFPITIVFALTTTALAIFALELDYSDKLQAPVISWLLASVLGIPLSVALHLRTELAPIPLKWKALLFAGLIVVIVGYGVWLPDTRIGLTASVFLQWGLLFAASHMLVSLSIHSPAMDDRTFWAFNMHTLMRFVLGVLFTAVLNVGVILAIVASDFLFNLNINETFYLKVTIFNHGLLMTAIIMSGIPNSTDPLEWEESVPKALRLFCLYVLLPLAFLYLTILLVYSGKVMFAWTLPQGIVGSMILYYAIVGYATHILTLPFQDGESKPTAWFGMFFRYSMPVVLILFWIAIGVRVDSYGLTIMRGLVIYLGLWLTGISLWALFTKGRPITIIPASLALMLVIGAVGPLSISSMSRVSQVQELRSLLSAASGSSDTERIRNTADLDSQSISRVSSGIFYLSNTHGITSLQPFIDESIATLTTRFEQEDSIEFVNNWQFSTKLMSEWNIPSVWNLNQDSYVSFNTTAELKTDIRGFDQYMTLHFYPSDTDPDERVLFSNDAMSVRIYRSNGIIVWSDTAGTVAVIDVIGHLKTIPYSMERGFVELDGITAELADTLHENIKLLIDSGAIRNSDGSWNLQALKGKLFFKTQ